jgi:hypothetical protein
VNQPPGGERHEQHANQENQRGPQLQSKWNEPSSITLCFSFAANEVAAVVLPQLARVTYSKGGTLQSKRKP